MNLTNRRMVFLLLMTAVVLVISLIVVYCFKTINKSHEQGAVVQHGNMEQTKTYVITYHAENGVILAKKDSNSDEIPKPPEVVGKVFAGWDKDIIDIKSDTETTAKYTDVSDDENAIALPAVYGGFGETVSIPLKILGKVDLCGVDVTISYDTEVLEYVGYDGTDKAVTVQNDVEPGLIYVRFVSGSNVSGEIDLSVLKFKVKSSEAKETDIQLHVKDAIKLDVDNNVIIAPYGVIDAKLRIL